MQNLGTLSPAVHFRTLLPKTIVEQFIEEITHNNIMPNPSLGTLSNGQIFQKVRNCKVTTLPTMHWFIGFIWHYISLANRENFLYDITCIENEMVSYIEYDPGDFYRWHMDHDIANMLGYRVSQNRNTNLAQENAVINGEVVRKLSFTVQLSSPDEYEGGELQLLRQGTTLGTDSLKKEACSSMITIPKELGLITIFDSRIAHRVRKVKSGKRKSLVGWIVGPRWK